jgi:hypothetical protein
MCWQRAPYHVLLDFRLLLLVPALNFLVFSKSKAFLYSPQILCSAFHLVHVDLFLTRDILLFRYQMALVVESG